ncbi:MAG TPA: serine hydrolase domain-containing protein, partial [Lysobacter sp.]|nr:serine hydrolase domain-containing protein [Lysobacter sp.]
MAAQAADPAVDAAFDAAMQRYRLPGLAVGVVENGEVVYTRTAGELAAGGGQPIDSKTLFKIASNTKAMTAATLGRLVDAGKLEWHDPVVKHLPQFRMHDAWVTREMQVRDLLIHNSGLPVGAGDLMLWPEPNDFTRADIIQGLGHLKPVDSFRSRYAYDNLLYIVAGEVAAAAGGAPYETLVRREVFAPLGMQRCQVGDWRADEVGNVAQPHVRRDGRNVAVRGGEAQVRASTMEAAGGIRCSLDDMLAWVRAWLSPQGTSAAWLSTAQRRAAWASQMPMPLSARMRDWDRSHFSAYGYGWRLADVDGVFKVAHTGTLMGMYSAVTMLPDRNVGFVILINGEAEDARTVLTQVLVKHYTARDPSLTVAHYAGLLDAEYAKRPAEEKAPDTSKRRPARAADLQSR